MRLSRSQTTRRLLFTAIYILIAGNYEGLEAFSGTSTNTSPRRHCCSQMISSSTTKGTSLSSSNDDGNNSGTNDDGTTASGRYWKLPNDFSLFLTQRSIQSFMFLTSQLRDPETCYWVEDFTQPNLVARLEQAKPEFSLSESLPNLSDIAAGTSDWRPKDDEKEEEEEEEERRTCHLLRYHGLAAMDSIRFPTWEAYFEELLEQPTDSWVIASEQSHIPNYTWDIDPGSLCSRILSVREQLSREFAKDLQAVSDMGGQTLDWYWDRLRQSRDQEQQEQQQQQQQQNNNNNNEGSENENPTPLVDPSSLRGSRENLLFLEINVDDPLSDHKPSPLRRGNFDLLVLLATEEAIHRVLNKWESKKFGKEGLRGSEFVSHGFLEAFYQDRQHFFHGPLPSYGKADDVLEELLSSALSFKADAVVGGGDSSSVINPTKIAELILREREQVALEWKEIAMEAPQHHMKIQKLRLNRMMKGNNDSSNSSSQDENNRVEETRNGGRHDPGPGAFE